METPLNLERSKYTELFNSELFIWNEKHHVNVVILLGRIKTKMLTLYQSYLATLHQHSLEGHKT